MAEMKGISCCGDCGNYNWKKHKCNICTSEGKAQDKFYLDCPLEDVAPIKHGEWVSIGLSNPKCTLCGKYNLERTLYCPNCGADMRKDLESGEING